MINIDKEAIKEKVWNRENNYTATEEWLTPAGNQRSAPMYEVLIENSYLNKTKRVKKRSMYELEVAVEKQLTKWNEQEVRKRIKDATKDAKEQAEAEWREKKENIEDYLEELSNILQSTLEYDDKIDWDGLVDKSEFHEFTFNEVEPLKPIEPSKPSKPSQPPKSFWDKIFPFVWNKKLEAHKKKVKRWKERCERIDSEFQNEIDEWKTKKQKLKAREEKEKAKWENKKQAFLESQKKHNLSIINFKERYESGNEAAIYEYFEAVFENSTYPDDFPLNYSLVYEQQSETLEVDLSLPNIDDMPKDRDYRLKKTTGEISPVTMKDKERDSLYEEVINQTVIRTIHEVFESDYANNVMQVVVNGWVNYVDKGTGNEKNSCIISVSADREKFENFNLERVEPAECIKALKGVKAGALADVAPVKPIMQLDKNDRRFVESEAILADVNSTTNLAEIDWEEFEHLVRELFEKMFSDEDSEVKVTQTSSDGGIDAIAFDPDPIRGGKFVIQAKRYTKVVPVAAVRDLYGTMISEGASKGLLVTTAHYGRDARAFTKDKPITLIDGSNLVYLLEEHGHKVRIDIKAARAKLDKKK
jgi:restriction system protein